MDVSIRTARDPSDVREWLRFPARAVYGADSPWVAPMESDLSRLLTPGQNPYFLGGDAVPLLARDARGAPVGRALAHLNRRENVLRGERVVYLGFFECCDIPEAAAALIRAAGAFGVTRTGSTTIRGPLNPTLMQGMGILLDGFDRPPAVDQVYTPSYYPALLEAAGLTPALCATTFVVALDEVDTESLYDPARAGLADASRVHLRSAARRPPGRDLELLRELFNESFRGSTAFAPISVDEWDFQVRPFLALIDPDLVLLAEVDGVPCGFVIAAPDYSPLLRPLRGRIGLSGALRLLWARIHPAFDDAVLTAMGVLPAWQGHGVMRMLLAELARRLRRARYRRLAVTWVADENGGSRALMRALAARPVHRVALYEGAIARGTADAG